MGFLYLLAPWGILPLVGTLILFLAAVFAWFAAGTQSIGLCKLMPERDFTAAGRPDLAFRSDSHGNARLSFELKERTRLHITPAV